MGSGKVALEVHLTLRITKEDLEPEQVTAALGIAPTNAHRRGDRAGQKSSAVYKGGFWSLDSESAVAETEPFDVHARWLLERMEPMMEKLRVLSTEGYTIDLWAGAFTGEGHGGPVIGADVLRRLGQLGIDMNLDLYPGLLDTSAE